MTDPDIYEARIPRRVTRLRIRACDYAVHEWGNKGAPLLVYLHGWGDSAPTFQFVVDAFERHWHVVAPDWRGFGDSRADVPAYWFPDYLADLDRLLDAYSPAEPVRLIGHSMGGNVAGLYAGSLPARVAAFVNLEGFGLPDSDPVTAPDRYRDWLHRTHALTGFSSYPDFAALAQRIRHRNPRMRADRAHYVAECWGLSQDGEVRLRVDPLHKLPNPVLYRRAEAEACWRRIVAPSLLVAGQESEIMRQLMVDTTALESAVPIAGAVATTIPDCGHMLHFDAPEVLAARIEAFLGETL